LVSQVNDLMTNALRKDKVMYLKGGNDKYLSYGGGGGRGSWEAIRAEQV
jgi:hypothetical protein